MILLYSAKTDVSAAKISCELSRRQVDYNWLLVSNFSTFSHLSHELGGVDENRNIIFTDGGEEIDFRQVSTVYVRPSDKISTVTRRSDNLLSSWINMEVSNYFRETLEMLSCRWFPCSPSLLIHLETEKFKELSVALEVGLRIPDTLVTNNPKLAMSFYRKHDGRVISKRYYTSRLKYRGVNVAYPTSPVSLRDIGFIKHVQYSPTLFQEYIPKQKELRITVVGENTVAAEIDSQKTHHTRHDWRNYDRARTSYKEHKLPKEVHDKLVALTKKRGLCYGTCDMIITPDGEYVFLEINPSGQYAWIETAIGVDITGLICDELILLSKNNKSKI